MPYKFPVNIPVRVRIRYVDACGGDYGPQARIKGAFDDDPNENEIAYIQAPAPDAFTALLQAGVIRALPSTLPATRADKLVSVPVIAKDVVITMSQAAGEKVATFTIQRLGAMPPAPGASPRQTNVRGAPDDYYPQRNEASAASAAAAPPAPRGRTTYSNPVYANIVEFVTDEIAPKVPGMTAADIIASAATLYIAETRRADHR